MSASRRSPAVPRGSTSTKRGARAGGQTARPKPTHFLCIPLVTATSRPQLDAALARFRRVVAQANREAAASQAGESGSALLARRAVPERAVRAVDTLHLTLGVMSLPGAEAVARARDVLAALDLAGLLAAAAPPAPPPPQQPLALSLRSLASMHPPRDTSVLYAEPRDASGRLLRFGEALRDAFVASGLMAAEDRPLKMHATVLNTVYAKVGRSVVRVDASGLLRECRDFVWSDEFPVAKVAICKMGSKEVRDDTGEVVGEAYEEVASKAMPE